MAGIIGQLTANARKRRGTSTIVIEKCAYILPPFHSYGYSPGVDNVYVVCRAKVQIEQEFHDKNIKHLQEWFLEKQVERH